jgi:hypothetical protein
VIRLIADANTSQRFIKACLRFDNQFPIVHVADWLQGEYRMSEDPVLLSTLRHHKMVIVSFDRRSMAMHATDLTRAGTGHAGVILFRRSVTTEDYGKQSRLIVEFWREAKDWDWNDRIEYLPRPDEKIVSP